MRSADNRRIPGWRVLREYLSDSDASPNLRISSECRVLIDSLPALLCDPNRPEDAADEPHAITHAPEALRYAVMSRAAAWEATHTPDKNFRFIKSKQNRLF